MRYRLAVVAILTFACSCPDAFAAGSAKKAAHKKADIPAAEGKDPEPKKAAPKGSAKKPVPVKKDSQPVSPGNGRLEINVTDVLGHDLPARVELKDKSGKQVAVFEAPKGRLQAQAPVGTYKAYTYFYCLQVPVLVDYQEVTVKSGSSAYLLVNLVEGASGNRSLFDFDQDCDFALDRVETKSGTDPKSAVSIPGREVLPVDDRVFEKKEGWYCGELHAHSTYGTGKESVAELVRRAEKSNLDFLAITDRNTIASCKDPGFKSSSVALFPALE